MLASLRGSVCFLASSAVLVAGLTLPASAYFKGGSGVGHASSPKSAHAHGAPHGYHHPTAHNPHQPQMSGGGSAGFAADAPRTRPAPARSTPVAAIPLLPITGGLPASVPRVTLHGDGDRFYQPQSHALQHDASIRRIEPGSFAPVDPRTFIGETPSGRIFMGAPAGVYTYGPERRGRAVQRSTPYAQPKFIVIGEPSRRHMSKPVHMTHGVQPPNGLRPDPQVVWLSSERSAMRTTTK